MPTHMMILRSSDKEMISQLIEEDIPTFVDNAIDSIDRGEDLSSIPRYAELLTAQVRIVDMYDVISFFDKISIHIEKGDLDQAKVDLVFLKNFVGDIHVIYS